jgi:hypothetical protein
MESQIRSETTVQSLPAGTPPAEDTSQGTRRGIIIGAIVVILLIAAALFFLISASPETTAEIRDIFIIFMALLLGLLMIAAIILILQLATLINLLQNEIKPMLTTMNETIHTVKGTTTFISNNVVEPVMKLNTFMAGVRGVMEFFRLSRR